MLIGVDKAQQAGKHDLKHKAMTEMGHTLIDMPVPVGDYIRITPEIEEVMKRRGDKLKKMDTIGLIEMSIDTKRNLEELYSCLVQGHQRFSDSCLLAKNNGIQLIILTENEEGVRYPTELVKWKNEKRWKAYYAGKKRAERLGGKIPRAPATPTQLIKTMWTMSNKYGVRFLFCHPNETAGYIVALLDLYGDAEMIDGGDG